MSSAIAHFARLQEILLIVRSHCVTHGFLCCVSLSCVRLRLNIRSHCVTQCFPCCVSLPCSALPCVSMCARPKTLMTPSLTLRPSRNVIRSTSPCERNAVLGRWLAMRPVCWLYRLSFS